MLRILGSRRTLCDGLSRRDFLHIGGLGVLGFGLADFWRLQRAGASSAAAARSFGQAKACILLFPYGSPPQHETFDPKPAAPAEIQGEMRAIATPVPGLQICDHLPRIAKIMDRVTVVRSVTHPYPEHGVAYAVSGIPTYTPALETQPRDSRHWPFIGSVVDYLEDRRVGRLSRAVPAIPRNIGLPWLLNSKTDMNVSAGPYAAFLGQGYDPVWTDYNGAGTRIAPRYTDNQAREFHDPFAEATAAGRFQLSPVGRLPADVPIQRLNMRRGLLRQLDRARIRLDQRRHG